MKLSECYCLGHPGQVIGEYEDLNYYTDVGTYICYTDAAAQKIEKALYKVLAENKNLTCDLGGSASTSQFTQEIINNL